MRNLDVTFEPSPWEDYLHTLQMGDTVKAGRLLALMEGEPEEALEDAFEQMELGCLRLSVEDLPASSAGEAALRLRRESELVKKGLDLSTLEEGDPLRLYLEEVAALPACGEEGQLSLEAAGGSERARSALTNLGLSRVIELAQEYTGYGLLLLDLIQEGNLGLWQAVSSFRGGDYPSHRDKWVHFYMAKAVTVHSRSHGVGARLRSAMEDYRQVDERLLGELGRNPTLEEIAQELHMSAETAFTVKKMLSDARAQALRKGPEPEEEEEEADQAVENTALFQMRQRILDLLSGLEEQDSRLLTLRFGLEGGLPLSVEETARLLGLTPEEVTRREAAALAKLREG